MRTRAIIGLTLALGVLTVVASAGRAANSLNPEQLAIDQTPPRLSYANGQVSFWRPGAEDWAQAQVNTPLAAGDELYTGSPATLELQIGAHAFVRGQANTQLGLENQEANFLQFKVTTGSAAFDLRTLEPGRIVEVDTPNAAFTIDRAGYYRVDVTGERTSFTTRRAGLATVTPASGQPVVITPSEEVVINGTSAPQLASYVAPQLDAWDNWNYARSDGYQDAVSARYVSPETYGVSDLDHYGTWRNVPDYGSVWVPTAAQAGWTPYSTGSWTQDPSYGWTWVDTAPWGWAPYHYGRWVSLGRVWAWAPGPVVARPVYAPALVAFFGGPAVSVGISIGGPVVGWVPLGWGEPVVPWWGRAGFANVPSWRGWGGPRVVNNTVINNTTVVNVQNINVYRNSGVQNAVVMVNENRFGRGPITSARITQTDVKNLQVIHTAPQIATTPASFVPTATRGIRPPEESLKRSVVATREPVLGRDATAGAERKVRPAGIPAPAPRLVSAPPQNEIAPVPARPPFGQSTVERPAPARAAPPPPPGAPATRQVSPQQRRETQVGTPTAPQAPADRVTAPPPPSRRPETPQVATPAPSAPQPPSGAPTPPARRSEPPQVKAPAPPPPAGRAETPQVATPAPSAPQPPSGAPTPPARRPEPPQVKAPAPPPRRPETPLVATPASIAPQPPAPAIPKAAMPKAPASRPATPQLAAPAPAKPEPPAGRAAAPPLPGEPANRLSPHRVEQP